MDCEGWAEHSLASVLLIRSIILLFIKGPHWLVTVPCPSRKKIERKTLGSRIREAFSKKVKWKMSFTCKENKPTLWILYDLYFYCILLPVRPQESSWARWGWVSVWLPVHFQLWGWNEGNVLLVAFKYSRYLCMTTWQCPTIICILGIELELAYNWG